MIMCTPSDVLQVWEHARGMANARRALALTALAAPAMPATERAAWSVGMRDRTLLDLRRALFGDRCTGTADCPQCAGRAEIAFSVEAIRMDGFPDATRSLRVVFDNFRADVRVPTAADLVAACAQVDDLSAGRVLMERCVSEAHAGDAPIPVAALPAPFIAEIGQQLANADPMADVELALICPHCGHAWNAAFDIASYLWSEINAWCVRTVQDIHDIATAYGWRESEILSLSPVRRQLYLEMIRA